MRVWAGVAAVLCAVLPCGSRAGSISGQLLHPRGICVGGVYTSCQPAGSVPGASYGFTSSSPNPDLCGLFSLLAGSGIYSHGFSEAQGLPLLYRSGVVVPAGGSADYAVLRTRPLSCCPGTEPGPPGNVFAQSFRAGGGSLRSIALETPAPEGTEIAVTLHDGDAPNAPQIGSAKSAVVTMSGLVQACWQAGDMPLAAGRIYTAQFATPSGEAFATVRQTVLDCSRAENPDGRTWVDGTPAISPLAMTVAANDDGLDCTAACLNAGSWLPVSQFAGQSFTARGSEVRAISWLTSSMGKMIEVTLHDGPGPAGAGGPQIGPKKFCGGAGSSARTLVTFAPGEAPTSAGELYYIKLRVSDGSLHSISITSDHYSGGQAFLNGVPVDADLALAVYEAQSPVAPEQPCVEVWDLHVEPAGPTAAAVTWRTATPSDSTVDYGRSTPYAFTATNSAIVTDHSVLLTGLDPNALYHMRAISRASGFREHRSRDAAFVTTPDSANLLAAPGFEGPDTAWTCWGTGLAPRSENTHGGSRALSGTAQGALHGGAFQQVAAVPGQVYRLTAWLYSDCRGDFFNASGQVALRIGIDPTGGTDPQSPTVIWTQRTNSHRQWSPSGLEAVAVSEQMTVFCEARSGADCEYALVSFDDLVLSGGAPAAPRDVPLAQALGQEPDGARVRITGAVCTAVDVEGADYIASPEGVCGLRIDTADAMAPGDRVMVSGTLLTLGTGQRCLTAAQVESRQPGEEPAPFGCQVDALGGQELGPRCAGVAGSKGPYNVGMFMKAWGLVTQSGPGSIHINDGSTAGAGVRVDLSNMTPPGSATVAVTGIVTLDSSGAVVLRPRTNSDLRGWP